MKPETRKVFKDFYFNVMLAEDFEKWVYANETLETELPENFYIALISSDFKNNDDLLSIKNKIKNLYDQELEQLMFKDRALEVSEAMLNSTMSLEMGCHYLAKLKEAGADFIPIAFVGFDSEFQDAERSNFFNVEEAYKNDINKETRNLILYLKKP